METYLFSIFTFIVRIISCHATLIIAHTSQNNLKKIISNTKKLTYNKLQELLKLPPLKGSHAITETFITKTVVFLFI